MRTPAISALLLLVTTCVVAKGRPVQPEVGIRTASAAASKHSDHRVIVRYAGTSTDASVAGAEIEKQAQMLQAQPNVVTVQLLPRVGMAVVSLASAEAGEQLVEDLQRDGSVELAVPDTWVSAFDLFGGNPVGAADARHGRFLSTRPAAWPAQCSAHPACRMRGLAGDCCPASNGMAMSCCSPRNENFVSLGTYNGMYVSASPDGAISQAAGALRDPEKFEIFAHGDGTVSFKSHYGKYLTADEQGVVRADGEEAGDSEKFERITNEEGTVSLKSFLGDYLTAEERGVILADRENASVWEQFRIQQQAGPDQKLTDDPALPDLWGMHNFNGFDIAAPEAWKVWTGEVGKGITVAVIDTGIDYTHEDLSEQMWVNPLEIPDNGIDDDENGYIDDVHGADFANEDGDPMDDNMHGTHCAGTIAGIGNNAVGVAGVAWRGVRLMALKFLDGSGSGRTSDAIRAIDYAVAHGAKIASNSWGGGGSSSALRAAIEHAEVAGMLFTAAAGNEGNNNDEVPSFPANYDIPNVISVASITSTGHLSYFSCYGKSSVHVAAPGSAIYSTMPHNGYDTLSGTSMATPHVSGLAALIWMYRPQLSMHQVKEIIIGSVRKLWALEGKVITGGLINAKNALEAAWAFKDPQPPVHAPQAIAFEDADPRIGVYGGVVTITAAADESDVEYYRVYMVSGAGFQLEALGDPIPATGEPELTLELNSSFVPSKYARALVAVSGRSSGEMPAQLGGLAPHVDLVDFVVPLLGPKSAAWQGDADNQPGSVKGSLRMRRAADETSVSEYHVYWRMANGTRGPLVGSIAGAGFLEPTCKGPSCAVIDQSKTADGEYVYERGAYEDNEQAKIVASGPARVEVTFFDTEDYYDTLAVGHVDLSGNLTDVMPRILELPEGHISIKWSSDESITANGWSFQLQQDGAVAELYMNLSEVLGIGFEVVSAYGENELMSGAIFVDIAKSSKEAAAFTIAPGDKRRLTASDPAHAEPIRTASGQIADEDLHPVPVRPKQEKEAWLRRNNSNSDSTTRIVWSEPRATQLSEVAARWGLVRSSFKVSGLDEAACMQPDIRLALTRAVAAQLPSVEAAGVRLRSISAVLAQENKARASEERRSSIVKVDLEIEPSAAALTAASLDRIEAQLILLASGRRAAARFDAALAEGLLASGAAPPSRPTSWHAVFGAAQQFNPKMLAVAAVPVRAEAGPGERRLRGAALPELV